MLSVARLASLVLVLLCVVSSSWSQSVDKIRTSSGTEFWVGFMPNYETPAEKISLYVTSATDNNRVTVETYEDGGVIVETKVATLTAGSAREFQLDVARSETRDREIPIYRAIRVTSTAPCTVFGYSYNAFSNDGFLAIPLPALGKQYFCFSYPDDYYYFVANSHLGGEFLIVAPYDNTEVTIKTSARTTTSNDGKTIGHLPGEQWTVMLQKGQTYLVQSTGLEFGVDDLTGSRVTSSKPIAFLTGHQRAQVGSIGDNSKDHLIEMLPSTEYWGTEYIDIPHRSRTLAGNYYVILSAENDNRISVNGAETQLNAGEHMEVTQVTTAFHVKSLNNKRLMVMQYSYYQGFNGDPAMADPFIVTLPPVSSFINEAIFTPPAGITQSIVTILSTASALDSISIQSTSTPSHLISSHTGFAKWSIPGTPYAATHLTLLGDPKAWTVSGASPFGIYLYGFGQVESFGYPAAYGYRVSGDTSAPSLTLLDKGCGTYEVEAQSIAGITELAIAHHGPQTPLDIESVNYNFQLAPDAFENDMLVKGSLSVVDPSKPAQAVIYVTGKNGKMTYQLITYIPEQFSVTPEWNTTVALVGTSVCQDIVIANASDSALVVDLSFTQSPSVFTLGGFSPLVVNSRSSRSVEVCFNATDTLLHIDTLVVSGPCFNQRIPLTAQGGTAQMHAEDMNFGAVQSGAEVCNTITLTNSGIVPIYYVSAVTNIPGLAILSPALPFTLAPGETIDVTICFEATTPGTFTDTITWTTTDPVAGKNTTIVSVHVPGSSVDEKESHVLSLSPNPTSGRFRVLLPSSDRITQVRAVDILGRTYTLPFAQSASDASSDVSSLPAGTYVVQIETVTAHYRSRLVIDR